MNYGKAYSVFIETRLQSTEGVSFYCPDCATVEGFLKYAPEIETQIDVRRVDFPKPRKEIAALLGEANQGCPVLVFDESSEIPPEGKKSEETGRAYLSDASPTLPRSGRCCG